MSFVGARHIGEENRRRTRRTRPRGPLMLVLAALVVGIVVAGAAIALLPRQGVTISASSSDADSDLGALADGGDRIAWRSSGTAVIGTWVQLDWTSPRRVDRVVSAALGERTYIAARLTFSDGSALMVTPDAQGDIDVSFPARTAKWARFTVADAVAGRRQVALATLRVDGSGRPVASGAGRVTATASSSASGSSPAALIDGTVTTGATGAQWLAAPDAQRATATLSWPNPRLVSTVRIWGPVAAAYDPAYSAAAALNGSVRFSDGSSVRISGVSGGSGGPTVISFTPRMVSSATVRLTRTIPEAVIGLREVRIGGVTERSAAGPLTVSSSAGTVPEIILDPASCTAGTAEVGRPTSGTISLICPVVGSSVTGTAVLRVRAAPGTALTAATDSGAATSTSAGDSSLAPRRRLATAVAGADGTATLTFPTAPLPGGPIGLVVAAAGSDLRPLHVQLWNGSHAMAAEGPAASGRQLVWDEEFDGPVSASASSAAATYGVLKPEYWGGSQFGDAIFDSPDSGRGTFAIGDGVLRIRAQPLGTGTDPSGLGRTSTGGLLSSLRVGATGFSAQYGYFEARMMAPAGFGTWPAFWAMNSDAATRAQRSTEVDAVELYGNRTRQTCHSTHDYIGRVDRATVRCIDSAIATDWATGWHTYGVQISPGSAQFFVDGREVMTQTGLAGSEQPFYFMVDLALGGGWPVDLAPSGGRADLYVDWIRVFV